jgi:hypothetical protein
MLKSIRNNKNLQCLRGSILYVYFFCEFQIVFMNAKKIIKVIFLFFLGTYYAYYSRNKEKNII